jgi:cyanate permease
MVAVSESKPDPVRVRRAQIARLASIGQRIGYLLFAFAIVAFFIGLATSFSGGLVLAIELCLLVGSIFLAPAIVAGYAVKAAERDDLEQGR